MAEFQLGDMAVYPGYGVAEITGLEKKEFSGASQEFYVLRVLGKDMTVMVPKHNAGAAGLRRIIDDAEVPGIYDVLRKRGEKISNSTWNRRYREYREKILSGSLVEIASVFRDLSLLRADKELSYGERNMLETARGLVIQELALARKSDDASIEKEIEEIFAAAGPSESGDDASASPTPEKDS